MVMVVVVNPTPLLFLLIRRILLPLDTYFCARATSEGFLVNIKTFYYFFFLTRFFAGALARFFAAATEVFRFFAAAAAGVFRFFAAPEAAFFRARTGFFAGTTLRMTVTRLTATAFFLGLATTERRTGAAFFLCRACCPVSNTLRSAVTCLVVNLLSGNASSNCASARRRFVFVVMVVVAVVVVVAPKKIAAGGKIFQWRLLLFVVVAGAGKSADFRSAGFLK